MTQEIPIYIISLQSAHDRRANIEKQFMGQNLSFNFFNAVNGRDGHKLFEKYNEKKTYLCKGYKMNAGQLGCYASHYLLWEKCIQDNTPMIVIEDDVVIDFDILKKFIKKSITIPERYECIRLFRNMSNRYAETTDLDFGDFVINKYNRGHLRATGYYITPSGAKKFLGASSEWFLPVDLYMDRFWVNKVECFGIKPFCFDQDSTFESSISTNKTRAKYKKGFWMKLRKELFNFSETIRRTVIKF